MPVETELVAIENPDGLNVILGQTHFIKTAEDVHEALVGSVPGIKFGVAFCEASGPELVTVFAATSNPLDVIVVTTRRGRGVLGVVDGERTKGLETEKDRAERIAFLRKIGYKLG